MQIWDRESLECVQVLQGHTGSVLCLQYDENVIISGSSDATVRYELFRRICGSISSPHVSNYCNTLGLV